MEILLPILIFCFFIFLFIVYILSHDDYVFLRKAVSIETIFNFAFLNGFFALFFARLFYVFSNPSVNYLNPLVFFLFTYFPGLSLTGAVSGSLIFLYLYNNKIPKGRIFDFFSVAFLGSTTIGFLIFKLVNFTLDKLKSNYELVIPFIYFIFFIIFIKVLLPLNRKGEFKDGTLGFMILNFYSVIALLINLWPKKNKVFLIFGVEDIILIGLFIFSIIILNRQEKLLQRFKSFKK